MIQCYIPWEGEGGGGGGGYDENLKSKNRFLLKKNPGSLCP